MVPLELLLASQAQVTALTEQIALLTRQLAEREAAAQEERAKLQLTIDALLAKLEEVLRKRKKAGTAEPEAAPAPAPPQADLTERPLPPVKPERKKSERKAREEKDRPELRSRSESVRPDHCGSCGGIRLVNKDSCTRTLVDWVASYVQERVIALTRCRCLDCGKVTAAPVPQACLPKTQYTAGFVGRILYCKYGLHLPWERIRGDFGRQGYPMASSTISDVGQRALDELRGIAKVIWAQVRALGYAHADATGLPVVADNAGKTVLGQMFFFGWGKLAAFRYAKDKEASTFVRLIGGFQGVLVLDASSTHNDALAKDGIRWAGCNAHGLRKFREAKANDPVFGAEGERWIASWFHKEREAQKQGLTGAALLAWRQAEIGPLTRGFKRWLTLVHPTVLPKSTLAEATRYYANYWRPLTAFLRDANLPLENNFAERNLRAQALGRNNWLFAVGHESAENTAVAYTLVQTAKLHGVDPEAYLAWALERVAGGRKDPAVYAKLTPAGYQEAQKAQAG